jgi:hypothetical protein
MARRALQMLRALLVAAGLTGSACLPNDTRPPPGSVFVTVSSDGVAADGIPASETLDGWSISFDKVLVVLGGISLDGDGCDTYSEAEYTRLFDMKTSETRKVSISYALGHCEFKFRAASPNPDTIVTEGASESDKSMMRTPGSDAFTEQAGISIYVRGHGSLGDTTKHFEWPFRFRARYEKCAELPDGGRADNLNLTTNKTQKVNLEVRAGVLFENHRDPDRGQPRFQVFADADAIYGNNDGQITLTELDRIPLSEAGFMDLEGFGGIDAGYTERVHHHADAAGAGEPSLEDYLYLVLFPAMIKYERDGTCAVSLESRGVGS